MAEKEFFNYVPEWKGIRARWKLAKEADPAAKPEASVDVHALTASETKAIAASAVSSARPRKGEDEASIRERAERAVEESSRRVFFENLKNPVGFRTLGGRALTTPEEIWADGAPQLVQELLLAIEDESHLEAGLRDRFASPSDGTPPATTA